MYVEVYGTVKKSECMCGREREREVRWNEDRQRWGGERRGGKGRGQDKGYKDEVKCVMFVLQLFIKGEPVRLLP